MKKKIILLALVIAVILISILLLDNRASAPSPKTTPEKPTPAQPAATFNKNLYSTTDPASIWVVVNKPLPLKPADYAPVDLVFPAVPQRVPNTESMQLRKVAATAIEKMFAAAKKEGLDLMISSGYRSYNYQVSLYSGYVKSDGQAKADQESARPSHSEHQTGLALDIEPSSRSCELEQCFATTAEGKWLAAHAYEYGFILRYTTDKAAVTGYQNEPWHFRYVGTELSGEMNKTDVKTLEEFFGVTGGTTFN